MGRWLASSSEAGPSSQSAPSLLTGSTWRATVPRSCLPEGGGDDCAVQSRHAGIAPVRSGPRPNGRRLILCVLALLTAAPSFVHAAEQDLSSGLVHLRAGRQVQAAQDLVRYRDGERDPEIRRSIERVLRLLKEPLSEELREYIALTLDEGVRRKAGARTPDVRPGFVSRMFPVFP